MGIGLDMAERNEMGGNKKTERSNSRNSRNTRPWMRSTIEFSVGSLEKEKRGGPERRDGRTSSTRE